MPSNRTGYCRRFCLPSTLEASDSSGGPAVIQFQRLIVMPDGSRHIEGVTPKRLAPPASPVLPSDPGSSIDHKENKDLEDETS
jgi:hypothetical protein